MPTEPATNTLQSHARSPSLRLLARISQYELLSRMWAEKSAAHDHLRRALPVVYSRDFAYENSVPMILDGGVDNIADFKAKDFSELISGPTVDVFVGSSKRRWTLHRNLLCHHSSFFEAELMGSEVPKVKRMSEQQKLELLGEDPAGFELFVKWLYQGRLDDTSELSDEEKYDYAVACHKLYRLCERLDMPELKNLSIDQYRTSLFEAQLVPDADEINEIYKMSSPGSPFRALMTKIAARQIMDPDSDKDAESYRACFQDNPDFAVEMINAIKTGTGGVLFQDPTEGGECEYHDHTNGAGCNLRPRRRQKAKQNKPPKPRLPEENLAQMLKALPTTSTDSSVGDWLSDTTLVSPTEERFPEVPPPTPAKPSTQVKAMQMELVISAAMGAMDTILEADRARDAALDKRGKQVPPEKTAARPSENPLNYVAALRLRQEHGRRKSRDLFEGLDS